MRSLVCYILILLSLESYALEIEGEFLVGQGRDELTVIGTSDFSRVQPVFAGFVGSHREVRIHYLQMSSREIDAAVRAGLSSDIDLVMSSAVDLQVRLVNDGYAQQLDARFDQRLTWRNELIQLAVEPVVTIFNRARFPNLGTVNSRRELAHKLDGNEVKNLQITMYDPAISGVGYLLSRQDLIQDEHFWQLLEVLEQHDFRLNCCSGDMIDQVVSGQSTLAYNVLESYVLPRLANAPELEILRFDDYQLAIPRTAFVPKQANDADLANALVNYFVSEDGQKRLVPSVRLDVVQSNRGGGPIKPIRITPALIVHLDESNRRRFFSRWDAVVNTP